jgi:hypothetical protein
MLKVIDEETRLPHHNEEIYHLKLMIAVLFSFQQEFEIEQKIKELKQLPNDTNIAHSEFSKTIAEFYENVKEWLTQLVIFSF